MKLRPFLLPVVAAIVASSVYFLPDAGKMAPSAVEMQIPKELNGWQTRNIPPSKEELDILAEDTTFSKAYCLKPRGGEFDPLNGLAVPDRIDLSIVLSGHDLNNSIHRPERCMPSQGHSISQSTAVTLKLPNGRDIPLRRLISVQSLPLNEERTKYTRMNCVTYYFFVGNHTITSSHLERTLIDVKDRLLHGKDQRWAYVSFSMWYGRLPWIDKETSIEEADVKLSEFIIRFSDESIKWDMISG